MTHRPLLCRKLSKYSHWKRKSDSVVLATTEGGIEGKCFPVRRRTTWIDDVRRWTGDDMNVARTNQWKEGTTAAYGIRNEEQQQQQP